MLKREILNTSRHVKKINYNRKITVIEKMIPRDTCLVTTAALNTKARESENFQLMILKESKESIKPPTTAYNSLILKLK